MTSSGKLLHFILGWTSYDAETMLGLTRALEVVYAKNIIQYMFSGKPMCEIQLRHLLDLCKISATVSIETNVWSNSWLKNQ